MNEADTTKHARTGKAFTLVEAAGVMLGRPIPHVQQDEQVLVPFTERNAVFIVHGDRARRVVIELEETGIDGTRISFLRLDSASLSTDEDATPSSQVISADSERRSERAVIVGAIIGGVAGAIIVGLLLLIVSGSTSRTPTSRGARDHTSCASTSPSSPRPRLRTTSVRTPGRTRPTSSPSSSNGAGDRRS